MPAWLVKQEPSAYPFDRLVADGRTTWDGVRNAQARANLRAMRRGDRVLYYHTGDEKAIVGLAEVARTAYPDPADAEWAAVDLVPVRALARPVTLAQVRAEPALAGMTLVRNARLSVQPVGDDELGHVLRLAGEAATRVGSRKRRVEP